MSREPLTDASRFSTIIDASTHAVAMVGEFASVQIQSTWVPALLITTHIVEQCYPYGFQSAC